jgi:hypothetical protein
MQMATSTLATSDYTEQHMYDTSSCSYSSRLLFVVLVPVATTVSLNGDALAFCGSCTNRAVIRLKNDKVASSGVSRGPQSEVAWSITDIKSHHAYSCDSRGVVIKSQLRAIAAPFGSESASSRTEEEKKSNEMFTERVIFVVRTLPFLLI